MRQIQSSASDNSGGVQLIPLGSVTGVAYEKVIVVGLAEVTFPRNLRSHAVVSEQVKEYVNGQTPLLLTNEDVNQLDTLAVALTVGSSISKPVVTFAAADLRSSRRRHWPQVLDFLVDETVELGSFYSQRADTANATTIDDVKLGSFLSTGLTGDLVDDKLSLAVKRSGALESGERNEFSGATGTGSVDINRRTHSATSIESFAQCPRKFFYRSVLRLSKLDDPEDTHEISALERGSLVHNVLEEFINQALAGDIEMPKPTESWSDLALEKLDAIASDMFDSAEARGATGGKNASVIAREILNSSLASFVEIDNKFRAKHGATPLATEFELNGYEDDKAAINLDGASLKIRGYVDRIDLTEDDEIIVVDYKTGKSEKFKDLPMALVEGTKVQLPLYGQAASQVLDKPAKVGEYWFVDEGVHADLDLGGETRSVLHEALGRYVKGLSAGDFPTNPGEQVSWPRETFENCKWCDFENICGKDRA